MTVGQRLHFDKGQRPTVYITDRNDNGILLGYLIAVGDDRLYDVEIAPHLVVLPDDGRTRNGVPA